MKPTLPTTSVTTWIAPARFARRVATRAVGLTRVLSVACAGLLAAVLAGCAASNAPPVLLSLPHDAAEAAPAVAPSPSAPVLVVRRVLVPEYLVARRVRYRADPSTLAEWPNTFWAERIEIGVTREFVAALRERLPGWTVCDATCGDHHPDLTLQLELVPLDFIRATRRLQARARVDVYTAADASKPVQLREQAYALDASADTPQAQAEALARLLGEAATLAASAVGAARP